MTATIEYRVYPDECDPYGHLNQAAFLSLFERARWEMLAAGPGMDVFTRHGVWPAVRKTTVEYLRGAFPGDLLRFDASLTHSGRTSFTLHQTARNQSGDVVAEADFVFVCIDREGQPVPVPAAITGLFGTRPSVRSGPTQHRAVRGLTLAVDIQGDGPAVLFLHGFPLDRGVWRHQLATLSGWQRIAPDLRGMGLSDVPAGDWMLGDYTDDLVALLDQLKIRQVVLAGLSMGGYIAFDFVRRHPDRVRALVLLNTRATADNEAQRAGRDSMISKVTAGGAGAIVEELLPRMLSRDSLSMLPRVVEHVRTMVMQNPAAGIAGALRAMRDRSDASPFLSDIRVPTLVIAGVDDPIVPVADARRMAESIPGAHFTVIPQASHLTPVEQPIAVSRVLKEFLDAL